MDTTGETQLQALSAILLLIIGAAIIGVQVYQDYALLYIHSAKPERLMVSNYSNPPIQPMTINDGYIYLMGEEQVEVVEVIEEIKIEEIPETRLNFSLLGLFDSRSYRLGGAVIHTGSSEPAFYRVGDELADGVVLVAVVNQGVVISRGGKRELLTYDESLFEVEQFIRKKNMPAVEQFQLQNRVN